MCGRCRLTGGALVGRRPILLDTALTIIAIVLMVITPGFVLALWYTCRHLNGSYLALFEFIAQVRLPPRAAMPCHGTLTSRLRPRAVPTRRVPGSMASWTPTSSSSRCPTRRRGRSC